MPMISDAKYSTGALKQSMTIMKTHEYSLTAVERPGSPLQDLEGESRHDVGLPCDHSRPLHGLRADGGDQLGA